MRAENCVSLSSEDLYFYFLLSQNSRRCFIKACSRPICPYRNNMPRIKISCIENDTAYFLLSLTAFDKNSPIRKKFNFGKLVELCVHALVCVFIHECRQVCAEALPRSYQKQQNFE
jgi:hypothetical protein